MEDSSSGPEDKVDEENHSHQVDNCSLKWINGTCRILGTTCKEQIYSLGVQKKEKNPKSKADKEVRRTPNRQDQKISPP